MATITIYFHRLPSRPKLQRIKERFRLTPITVNGLSQATVLPADEPLFLQCAALGFFQIRGRPF